PRMRRLLRPTRLETRGEDGGKAGFRTGVGRAALGRPVGTGRTVRPRRTVWAERAVRTSGAVGAPRQARSARPPVRPRRASLAPASAHRGGAAPRLRPD